MHKEHFQAIKCLRSNEQILITKPDKGSGVVILSKSDYIKKMGSILHDKTKFLNMGGVDFLTTPQNQVSTFGTWTIVLSSLVSSWIVTISKKN